MATICFVSQNRKQDIELNIGGIGNFTYYLPGGDPKNLCYGYGPGNTLIDQLVVIIFRMNI